MPLGFIFILMGFLAGGLVSVQGIINGRLSHFIGGPTQAALVSFSVGCLFLVFVNLVTRRSIPTLAEASAAPWWAWTGGFFGALVVTSAALIIPKVGIASWTASIITGSLVFALWLDHIGAFGQLSREINFMRVVGASFLLLGVYIIRRF
ncbi:MAG: DMT family transporter [Pseudomonadota bacterium]